MKILYKLLCVMALLAVTYVSYGILPSSIQDLHPFSLLRVLSYVLLVVALSFAIFDRLYSRILRVCTGVAIALTIVCVLLVALGMVQDMLGVVCPGFMQPHGSCVLSISWIALALISTVYMPGVIIAALALVVGMIDEMQRRKEIGEAQPPKTQA